MTEFKRARGAKEKEQRRHSILESAKKLYLQDTSGLPTTAKIGKDAGVAKGTLYLYFRSKEEIFLAILEDFHLTWFALFEDVAKSKDASLNALINNVCQYLEDNPLYLQLASMSSSVIEQNVDSKILLANKNEMVQSVNKAASAVHKTLPMLTQEQIATLIMRSYALLLGLWQLSHPTENIAKVLQSPSLQVLKPEFASASRESITQLWQAAIERTKPEKKGVWSKLFS